MSERTDWNTCDCCGLVEVSTDLIWDTDEVFFSNEYEKLRFLKAALVPSEAVCQSCLNLVEEIKKPSLETITSRRQENNLIFRVGEFVLLSNVEWADKPRVSNYIAKIVSLDENKKTYTLEGYGDVEFKEDEFYDVVSEAYVREFRNFIDDSYPDKSDKIYQETEPNGEGISKIDYAFEGGYKEEFIEHLKSKNLPYGRFLEPKYNIGDSFRVSFPYYEDGETTEHIISKIDKSFNEADEIVYWDDNSVYITESELDKQKTMPKATQLVKEGMNRIEFSNSLQKLTVGTDKNGDFILFKDLNIDEKIYYLQAVIEDYKEI